MIAAATTSFESDSENVQRRNNEKLLLTFDPIALKYVGRRVEVGVQRKYTTLGENHNMCFKLVKCDSKLVKNILFSYGFLQCSSRNPRCNLLWTNTHLSAGTMRQLRPWQRMNHFPRSWMLTRKDLLYENIDRTSIQFGCDWFNFIPEFCCTPLTDAETKKLFECCKEIELGKQAPFIVKPAGGSFGRGIFFLSKADEISSIDNEQKLVISRYIDRPYLINGLKWDLRIYVLVTSFYPLIVYVYSDGLARFAVHKYNDGRANFNDFNQHLTNYVLNKTNEAFVRNTDCTIENMGHKWTLGALLRHLEKDAGVDTELLMVRIEDVIIKSLLSIQPKVAAMCRKLNLHPKCCFELFGFDILVDEQLKPWLLEMNLSPSLTCDSPLDTLLKSHLFCDVLNIAQIPLVKDKNVQNDCCWSDAEAEEQQIKNDKRNSEEKLEMESISHGSSSPCSSPSSSTNVCSSSSTAESQPATIVEDSSEPKEKQNKELSPPKRTSLKRFLQLQRSSRLKKMKFTQKVRFSADQTCPKYKEYVALLFDKLNSEDRRRGYFNRIFPRRTTLHMYGTILEDSGHERWDEALQNVLAAEYDKQLSGAPNNVQFSAQDIRMIHAQLMDTQKYPHRNDLSDVVRDEALAEALCSAQCYKRRKLFAPGSAALPKLRPAARRRTRSQCMADEVRKVKLEQKRQELAMLSEVASTSSSAHPPPPPLLELDPNVPPPPTKKQKEADKQALLQPPFGTQKLCTQGI